MTLASYILSGLGASSIAAYASPTATVAILTTSTAANARSTACGDIVQANSSETFNIFNASEAYDCLTSIPFNADVATRFLKYYNDTLQFQSTLAYLKNPPQTYQQPATDLLQGIARIQQAIDQGLFPNQYAFEATVQQLVYSAHDDHVQLVSGALAAFSFSAPFEIASVSIDGIQLPKVYVSQDLFDNVTVPLAYTPSAIKTINDKDVTEYLTEFAAANSVGGLEEHADWNMLFQSPALDIQGFWEVFAGTATFYPGDTLKVVFENGTHQDHPWLAAYNSPGDTGPLETGGDFYNFFVLGLYPQSYFDEIAAEQAAASASAATATTASATDTTAPTDSSTPTSDPTGWGNQAYPETADVVQPDLATTGGGFLSGYFLNDSSVAVLSIPSFNEYDETVGTFSNMTAEFIRRSKAAGLKKVVIDLQQNSGGNTLLAIDTYKQFFPDNQPYVGSRRRKHLYGDLLGEVITPEFDYFSNDTDDEWYYDLAVDEWTITDKLNAATGRNFSSWDEYSGPAASYNGDSFSHVERYNLSSWLFDVLASGYITVYGYDDRPATSPQPYAAEDIIILSDGLCSSACSVFMELMHHEAGVRTVAVGGRPEYGPMQAPAGSRGARAYTTDTMDADITFAQSLYDYYENDTAAVTLPNRTVNQDVWITYMSINLRDQVRKGDDTPNQFKFEAADCRIFYTPQTWYNYTNLWKYAADAIWTNTKLCVQGSTGYTATGNTTAEKTPPTPAKAPTVSSNITGIYIAKDGQSVTDFDGGNGIPDTGTSFLEALGKKCPAGNKCPGRFTCHAVQTCSGSSLVTTNVCVDTCNSGQTKCGTGGDCRITRSFKTADRTTHEGLCLRNPPHSCVSSSQRRVGVGPPPGG